MDPVVDVRRGEVCRDQLVAAGYGLEWSTYPMQHEVCREELVAVGGFLRRVLSSEPPCPSQP
jgi:phospholipase/carboxylesterase